MSTATVTEIRPVTLVFLDTETSGLDPSQHQLLEVAWQVGPHGPVQSAVVPHDFATNPPEPKALEVNRYYERGLDNQACWDYDALERLYNDLEGATFIGANPAFDSAFLTPILGQPWHYRMLDIQAFAFGILGPAEGLPWATRVPSLATITARLNAMGMTIPDGDHTAAGDVRTLVECWKALVSIRQAEALDS